MLAPHIKEELDKLSPWKRMRFFELAGWSRSSKLDLQLPISMSAADSMLKMVQNMEEPIIEEVKEEEKE